MKLLKIFLTALLSLAAVAPSIGAQTLDEGGYPYVYLRGNFNGWQAADAYRFSRQGDLYTLHVDHLEGDFKLADQNWELVDYGADALGSPLSAPMAVDCLLRGGNITCTGLDNVDIRFEYGPANLMSSAIRVEFGVNGVWPGDTPGPVDPADPTDPTDRPDIDDLRDWEGYPIAYIRGEMNGWAAGDPAYRFSRQGNVYSIHLDNISGQFKVGDCKWELINLGADPNGSNEINGTCALMAFYQPNNSVNFRTNGLSDVVIKFEYDPSVPHNWGDYIPMTVSVGGEDPGDVPTPGPAPDPNPVDKYLTKTLPVMYINIYKVDAAGNYVLDAAGNRVFDNEVIDKDLSHKNYFSGEYWLDVTHCGSIGDVKFKAVGSADEPLPLEMKARGNWTRKGFSKKPFKIKLGKKQNLLGLTPDKSKHYALMAHADDHYGFLRNFVGFDLGRRIGLPWTPSQQPLELVVNGNYRGLYFLTESIRIGDGRIDVTELKDNSEKPEEISGGYLIELDNYDEPAESQIQLEEKSCADGHYIDMLRITFNTPEVYSEIMRRFVAEQFTTMNDLVGSCAPSQGNHWYDPCDDYDAIWSYIDLDDAVRYYIVREIISDVESYHGSTYMFRDRGEGQKWHFSPLWDHGNAFNGRTDAFFYDCDPYGNTWIPSLRRNETFNDKLSHTWTWFMGSCYDGIEDDINTYVEAIREATKADAKRWGDAPTPVGGTSVVNNTDIDGRRNAVLSHLRAKIAWLTGQWGQYYPTAEPARDTTPAAPLPSYAQSGVESVAVDACDAPAAMFDLMGRPVANPQAGTVVVVRQGGRVEKRLMR